MGSDGERKRRRRRRTGGELGAALERGEWLTTGEVAELLRVDPATVHRLQAAGRIKYKLRPGTGYNPTRECDPVDVADEKRRREEVHRKNFSGVDPSHTTFRAD